MSTTRSACLGSLRLAAVSGLVLLLAVGLFRSYLPHGAGPSHITVRGRVFDGSGPAVAARVRVKGKPERAATDARGQFSLTLPAAHAGRITAWKSGYYISGAARGASPLSIRLSPLPGHDNPAYQWIDSRPLPDQEESCGNCHLQIFQQWQASGHARSATNRRFLNMLNGTDWDGQENVGWNLMADLPEGAGVCTSCHAPSVEFDNPAFHDLRQVAGVSAQGVHCDYCHKVCETDIRSPGLTHGRDGLKLLRPSERQVFFGSMDDVDTGNASYLPLYADSRVCAPCHEGILFGTHVYGTYSEWLASPAAIDGRQCQSCHMAPSGRMRNIAPGRGGIDRDPMTLANHGDLGERSERLRRCLRLELQERRQPDGVHVKVEVALVDVGHRMPTGFIDRQLILVVDVRDASGNSVELRSGPRLPNSAGSLSGKAGRLYAKQAIGLDGRTPLPFWMVPREVTDDRLSPSRPDRIEFVFADAAAKLHVRLLYRPFWEEVARSKGWPPDEIVVFDRTYLITGSTGSELPSDNRGYSSFCRR